jgi:hypothetical protein
MFIYLLSLIIWNLILPMYAFWNFDDFSWYSIYLMHNLILGAIRAVLREKVKVLVMEMQRASSTHHKLL